MSRRENNSMFQECLAGLPPQLWLLQRSLAKYYVGGAVFSENQRSSTKTALTPLEEEPCQTPPKHAFHLLSLTQSANNFTLKGWSTNHRIETQLENNAPNK